MNKNKSKKTLINIILIIIIVILMMVIKTIFTIKQELKFSLIRYKSIPHIELTNTLSKHSDLFFGSIKGFVVFKNKNDQPKNLRQYYIIKPTLEIDEKGNQFFTLQEIIVMDSLSPRNISETRLIEKEESLKTLLLEDKNGNQFFIDKTSTEVLMKNVTRDTVKLITSDLEYRNFIRDFLK